MYQWSGFRVHSNLLPAEPWNTFAELGYFGLFVAAFLAATILPLSSETLFGCSAVKWIITYCIDHCRDNRQMSGIPDQLRIGLLGQPGLIKNG